MLLLVDYQNAVIKLINQGLNIALPPDLIGEGRYTRLTNVRTLQEGQLTTRFGLDAFQPKPAELSTDSVPVHIFRISDEFVLLVYSTGEVYVNGTPVTTYDYFKGVGDPRGSILRENLVLIYPEGYDDLNLRGQPAVNNVSIVRYTSKVSGDSWAYLATEVGMWKVDKWGIGYKWGIRPPVETICGGRIVGQTFPLTRGGSGTGTGEGGSPWGPYPPYLLNTNVRDPATAINPDFCDFQETRLTLGSDWEAECPPDPEGDRNCGLDNHADSSSDICVEPYVWVYTYYASDTGAESNACGEMTSALSDFQSWSGCPTDAGGEYPTHGDAAKCQKAIKLTGFVFPTDPQVDRYRIYRKGGCLPTYRLEDEIPIFVDGDSTKPTTFYISFKFDADIAANQVLSEDNYVPFTSVISPSGTPDAYGLKSDDPLLNPVSKTNLITGPTALFETPMGRAWGPYQGSFIFATGDKLRPGIVYWTNGGFPDSSSLFNELQVSSAAQPLIAGFIFGGNSYVFSRDELYALDYSGGSTPEFIPRQIPMGLGLSASNCVAVGPSGVYFLAKDGIYVTDCTTFATPLTKDSLRPIFLGQVAGAVGDQFQPLDWAESANFRLSVCSQELHFLYLDTAGNRQHLVYDIPQLRWQKFQAGGSLSTTCIYGDINKDQYQNLIGLSNGAVYQLKTSATGEDVLTPDDLNVTGVTPTTADIPVAFRTGAADLGSPLTQKEWGVLMIDADMPAAAACVVTPYYNAERETPPTPPTTFSLVTSGRETKTFNLQDLYKKNISLDFTWNGLGTVYQVTVQWRLDEEEVIHWFAPADTLGIPGWKHVRDGYFGLRSTTDLNLTVVIDDTYSRIYTIPSTGGALLNQHVYFEPWKGKVFQFSIDSPSNTPFRVYADDTFVNVKMWNTGNTYTKFQIGGAGGYRL